MGSVVALGPVYKGGAGFGIYSCAVLRNPAALIAASLALWDLPGRRVMVVSCYMFYKISGSSPRLHIPQIRTAGRKYCLRAIPLLRSSVCISRYRELRGYGRAGKVRVNE